MLLGALCCSHFSAILTLLRQDQLLFGCEQIILVFYQLPVADPGFPRGGGANTKGGGVPTYYLANFSGKLHENEEILGQGGARVPRAPP